MESFQEIVGLAREPLILVDRIAGHIEQLAAVHRLMIAVDDVQWADRLSRYALRSLIARLSGRPVVWVLASRSDDAGLTVSAADTVGVEHLRLDPLPRAVLAEIARDRLGNSLNGCVDELLDAAGGNPLLATHIIDGAARYAETGRDEDIPAEFRAAVYQRLDGLPSTATELIEALAAAEGPPDLLCIPVGNAGNVTSYWRGFSEMVGGGYALGKSGESRSGYGALWGDHRVGARTARSRSSRRQP